MGTKGRKYRAMAARRRNKKLGRLLDTRARCALCEARMETGRLVCGACAAWLEDAGIAYYNGRR